MQGTSVVGLILLAAIGWQSVGAQFVADIRSTGCSIALSGGLPEPQPLLIHPGTSRFFEPQSTDGLIRLTTGQSIELFCSGSFAGPFSGFRRLMATCGLNGQFVVDGKSHTFTELRCSAQVAHTARRTGRRCGLGGRHTHIEVGFVVESRFLRTMEICHDEQLESTLYSVYEQSPFNVGFQRSFPRPSFIAGDFFGRRNVDRLYTKVSQMATIGQTIGDGRVAQLWDDSRDIYLARGHLAAKADFVFGSQQRSTFYFVNVAPQWQRFNAGNWEAVENGVRVMVAARQIRAQLYTGTWGVLQLNDASGRAHPIFLDHNASGAGRIPVPALYYKVVIDLASRRGIVLIGVNNPHATPAQIAGEYRLCTDVSHLIGWLNWDRTNVQRGFSYACDVNEFVARVRDLPDGVRTSGLLL